MKPKVGPPKVTFDRIYPYTPERVWRALTEPERLAKWLLPGDFEPSMGHRFRFRAESGEDATSYIACEVISLEEGRRLAYTWQAAPDQPPTLVTWTLELVEGGTRVRLEHTAAVSVPAASAQGNAARASFARRPQVRRVGMVRILTGGRR